MVALHTCEACDGAGRWELAHRDVRCLLCDGAGVLPCLDDLSSIQAWTEADRCARVADTSRNVWLANLADARAHDAQEAAVWTRLSEYADADDDVRMAA